MSVRIFRVRGSCDGIRYGLGWQYGDRRARGSFAWSYDMLNDRVRLWRNPGNSRWIYFLDAECEAAVRVVVDPLRIAA